MFQLVANFFRETQSVFEGRIARIGMALDGADVSPLQFTLVVAKTVFTLYAGGPPNSTYPIGLSKPGDFIRFVVNERSVVSGKAIRNQALERELDLTDSIPKDPRLAWETSTH